MKNLVNAIVCSFAMLACIAVELYPSGKVMMKATFCKINVEKLIDATPKLKKYASSVRKVELNKVLNAAIGSYCTNSLK